MALTVKLLQPDKVQIQSQPYGTVLQAQVAAVNFDSSYPSGGYPCTPTAFGMLSILGMTQIGSGGSELFFSKYDSANNTLRVYQSTVTASAGGTATLSTFLEIQVGQASLSNVSPTFLVVGF